jgi:hypothetical protein
VDLDVILRPIDLVWAPGTFSHLDDENVVGDRVERLSVFLSR